MHNQVTRLVIDELRDPGSATDLTLWTQHMKVDWQIKQEQE